MYVFGQHRLALWLLSVCLSICIQCCNLQVIPLFQAQTNKIVHSKYVTGQDQRLDLLRLKSILLSKERFESVDEALEHQSRVSGLFREDPITNDLLDLLFTNVSAPCAGHFGYALENMANLTKGDIPELWVLQMFDSYGKFHCGILSGHTSDPGDFQECVEVHNGERPGDKLIRGRYCATYLYPGWKLESLLDPTNVNNKKNVLEEVRPGIRQATSLITLINYMLSATPPVMLPMLGVCLPASCSVADTQIFLNNFHTYVSDGWLGQEINACYVEDKPPLDAGDYSMMTVLIGIAALCIVGTALDVQRLYSSKVNTHQPGKLLNAVLMFSFYTNTKKFLSTKSGADNFGCLHGLRFLSMSWVVLCHTFEMMVYQLSWNLVDLKLILADVSLAPVLNGTLSVDTFFTLSGALVTYSLMKELDKRKGRFNYFMFALHRYLRLTPAYAIVVGLMATFINYLGNGPMWFMMEVDRANCRKYWWHNLLYVNNLIKYDIDLCYSESWYLANDMQFFLLSPLLIYPLWRFKRIGLCLTALAGIASVVIPAIITAEKSFAPTVIYSIPMKGYFENFYIKPWNRFGSYLVGIGLGYILYLRSKSPAKLKIHKAVVISCWILSTVLVPMVMFGGMYYFDPENEEETFTSAHAAIYAGAHRQVYCVCIAWIIFACISGYGGWVNRLLSWKVFMPLGRLTFCMYITSNHLQLIYHVMQPHHVHSSVYNTVFLYFSHMVMSAMVAYFLTTAVETPFMRLEKMLFASQLKPKQSPEN